MIGVSRAEDGYACASCAVSLAALSVYAGADEMPEVARLCLPCAERLARHIEAFANDETRRRLEEEASAGGRRKCDACGQMVLVRGDGRIRYHNSIVVGPRGGTTTQRRAGVPCPGGPAFPKWRD